MTQETEPLVVPYQRESHDSLTKYDLGVLAVRLFGLYCLFYALVYASFIPNLLLYQAPGGPQPGLVIAASCTPCVFFVLTGIFMLARTATVIRRAFPEFAAGTSLSATGRDLQAVLFSAIGIWLIASAVPDAARTATNYLWVTRGAISTGGLQTVPEVVRIVVEIAAGIFLFARAKGISAAWHRIRYAGIAQAPHDDAGATP